MEKKTKYLMIALASLLLVGCDSKTNENEQKAYQDWKHSEKAEDLNGDRRITLEDYHIYLEFNKWYESEENFDYNDDGIIDILDFDIDKKYKEWINNDDLAMDLNGDRKINYEDFKITETPKYEEFLKWYNSPEASDINGDGYIDYLDFNKLELDGTYKILDYKYSGNLEIFLNKGSYDLLLRDFNSYIDQVKFSFLKNKLTITIDDELKRILGQSNLEEIYEVVNNAIVTVTSNRSFNVLLNVSFNDMPKIKCTLYFESVGTQKSFKTVFTQELNGLKAIIEMTIGAI